MQTFLISSNPFNTAIILDNKRLGKQRVEATQIASILLDISNNSRWKNHPAVLMWKGYETFLVEIYLRDMMIGWVSRGYDNTKTYQTYKKLRKIIRKKKLLCKQPPWFCEKFFISHKSNLIRKDKEYYSKFFPSVPDNIPYWWPTKNGF